MNYQRNQNIGQPRSITPKMVWYFLGFLMLASFVAGDKGFYTQWKLIREKKHLQQQIETGQLKCDSLRTEINDLNNNLSRIEKEARKNGMGAKDEMIIIVRNE
jgi:cell division protein FtsB